MYIFIYVHIFMCVFAYIFMDYTCLCIYLARMVLHRQQVTCSVLEPHRLLGLPGGQDVCYTRPQPQPQHSLASYRLDRGGDSGVGV